MQLLLMDNQWRINRKLAGNRCTSDGPSTDSKGQCSYIVLYWLISSYIILDYHILSHIALSRDRRNVIFRREKAPATAGVSQNARNVIFKRKSAYSIQEDLTKLYYRMLPYIVSSPYAQ